MANRSDRRHVWAGDHYDALIWMVSVGPGNDPLSADFKRYLVLAMQPAVAAAMAMGRFGTIPDEWSSIEVLIRPLTEQEAKKVSISPNDVVDLDIRSYIHLTEKV